MAHHRLAFLRGAIRDDHKRTSVLLGRLRCAWTEGELESAQRRFHRVRHAILRHLEWEEGALIGRFRDRALEREQIGAVEDDCAAHREVRTAVRHLEALLPQRTVGDAELDRRLLGLVEALDRTIDAHRLGAETRLCDALEELITPAQCDEAARAIEGAAGAD